MHPILRYFIIASIRLNSCLINMLESIIWLRIPKGKYPNHMIESIIWLRIPEGKCHYKLVTSSSAKCSLLGEGTITISYCSKRTLWWCILLPCHNALGAQRPNGLLDIHLSPALPWLPDHVQFGLQVDCVWLISRGHHIKFARLRYAKLVSGDRLQDSIVCFNYQYTVEQWGNQTMLFGVAMLC